MKLKHLKPLLWLLLIWGGAIAILVVKARFDTPERPPEEAWAEVVAALGQQAQTERARADSLAALAIADTVVTVRTVTRWHVLTDTLRLPPEVQAVGDSLAEQCLLCARRSAKVIAAKDSAFALHLAADASAARAWRAAVDDAKSDRWSWLGVGTGVGAVAATSVCILAR